jgi:hypothetical protein
MIEQIYWQASQSESLMEQAFTVVDESIRET